MLAACFVALVAIPMSQATEVPGSSLSHAVVIMGWSGAGTRAIARLLDQSGVFIATGSGSDKCAVNPFSPKYGDLACVRGTNDQDTGCSDTHLGENRFGCETQIDLFVV